jgi:ribonucleotide reductase alpha subunit
MIYAVDGMNGSDMTTYDAFITILKRNGLYDPVAIGSYLKSTGGSVMGMYKIYNTSILQERCKHVESLFVDGFSINKKRYIHMVQQMGIYVDQAQSLTIFYDYPNLQYEGDLVMIAWVNGCKTFYYVRRKVGSPKVGATQLDIPQVCTMEPGCKMCE